MMIYDLAILGGGPAGVAAGVYASRKNFRPFLLLQILKVKSTVSDDIQNWIGTISISGQELAESLQKHLEHYAEDVVKLQIGEYVKEISKKIHTSSLSQIKHLMRLVLFLSQQEAFDANSKSLVLLNLKTKVSPTVLRVMDHFCR